jgi:hypothetical protein
MPGRSAVLLLALPLLSLACGAPKKPLVFEDKQGFHFTPPPGWAERDREGALPAGYAHKGAKLPLPPIDGSAKAGSEHLLARYDRVTAGYPAWLRVSVAEVPGNSSLTAYVTKRSPGSGWKRQGEVENLDVGGLPAARVAFAGRWQTDDYTNETVAVRRNDSVYLITASFPAADAEARAVVRQAVEQASWR